MPVQARHDSDGERRKRHYSINLRHPRAPLRSQKLRQRGSKNSPHIGFQESTRPHHFGPHPPRFGHKPRHFLLAVANWSLCDEREPISGSYKPLHTIWFKPDISNAAVSAVLGQNSWLWLPMIISSSFVIFLVLMGILTTYCINPIDHNSKHDNFRLS